MTVNDLTPFLLNSQQCSICDTHGVILETGKLSDIQSKYAGAKVEKIKVGNKLQLIIILQ